MREEVGGVGVVVVVGGDGDVEELSLLPEVAEGVGHVGAELAPTEAELLHGSHSGLIEHLFVKFYFTSFHSNVDVALIVYLER